MNWFQIIFGFWVVAIGFIVGPSPALGLTPEHQQAILNDFSANDLKYAADALNPEEQQWFLAYLLKEKERTNTRVDGAAPQMYDAQLLQLRHEPTIQRHGAAIRIGFAHGHYVTNSNQPRLIEFFEDELLINEPATPRDTSGDVPPGSRSVAAASMMLQLTFKSREIPAETRVWASRLYEVHYAAGGMDPDERRRRIREETRLIVRKWWADNKAAFKAREFEKVKPGVIHSSLTAKSAETTSPSPADEPEPDPKEPTAAAPPEPIRKEGSILPLLLVAGLLVLLALGVWLGKPKPE